MRSFIICTHAQILSGRESEVSRACGSHGRGEESVQGFDGQVRRKETTWKTKA
jgi:hypothetical protein